MSIRRRATAVAMALPLVMFGAACGDDDTAEDTSVEATSTLSTTAEQDEVTVELEAQGDQGVSGTATLSDAEDGGTRVVVELDDEGDTPRPAHIHEGTCEDLNPEPLYPLENVTDGTSETVVEPELDELLGQELAINVHLSAEELSTYISCGELPQQTTEGGGTTGETTETTDTTEDEAGVTATTESETAAPGENGDGIY